MMQNVFEPALMDAKRATRFRWHHYAGSPQSSQTNVKAGFIRPTLSRSIIVTTQCILSLLPRRASPVILCAMHSNA
jgi:hypothetical protein